MKKIVMLIFVLAMCIVSTNARNPVGYYYVKYIAYNNNGKTDLAVSKRTVYVEKNKITAFNTLQGKKYWEVKYLGMVNMSKYGNFSFHKFYLKNKGMYFYVSDERMITGKDGRLYYMIEFDGQVQLAD